MNEYYFSFHYKFKSGTGPLEGHRYVRNFKMKIFAESYDTEENLLIGKVVFKIIYVENAINTRYNLFDIFDSYEYTFRHGNSIFDFEIQEINNDIQEHYNYEIFGNNICILERIEILPRFRGHNLTAKATKDIIFHFGAGCALFVIQPYPLQFEVQSNKPDNWQEQLELKQFTTDEKNALKKLVNYYKSFGFERIKGYDDLLFYNPFIANKKMDSIDLEE